MFKFEMKYDNFSANYNLLNKNFFFSFLKNIKYSFFNNNNNSVKKENKPIAHPLIKIAKAPLKSSKIN
jgi:hypothetical protein